MSLGAGALKVEGPIAQNGSIALEVTMATKRAPTTQHCHTKRVQWNTYHNPYLPIQGWEEWEMQVEGGVISKLDKKREVGFILLLLICKPLRPVLSERLIHKDWVIISIYLVNNVDANF